MDSLVTFFLSLRWQDIIDIVLNSYILFRFYVLFRGTQTFRVLIGILFLWFFQKIAVSLGLIVTSWVIQGITAVGALIIVVIFRNEIRSVFQAKDLKAILWGFPKRMAVNSAQTIVDTVFELSGKRIGALIVFSGRDDLSEHVHAGTLLKGLVSKEMIVSIFWKGNPVHDGAIIIEKDQIANIGVILPLSKRSDLPSKYGTRHRAALGLAEVSDAIVIIVSEETGAVSIAKDSQLIPITSEDELIHTLERHSGVVSEDASKKDKYEIVSAAIICVLFISSVWFSFTSGRDTLFSFEVPITYQNQRPGMVIVEISPPIVRLHVSGSGALIKALRPEQVKVNVDLKDIAAGKNVLPVLRDNISIPPGIVLNKINPETVEVLMDMIVTKKIPVQIDWDGSLSEHLIMQDAYVFPDTVKLRGQSLVLKKISTVYTKKISLNTIKQSGQQDIELIIDPALNLDEEKNKTAIIHYSVQAR